MSAYLTILIIYCVLFVAQIIACQLAHSSILLFDTYVILYKIMDLLLKIITNHIVVERTFTPTKNVTNRESHQDNSIVEEKSAKNKLARFITRFQHHNDNDNDHHHSNDNDNNHKQQQKCQSESKLSNACRLWGRHSTFGIERIHIVGSLVNGLFLSGLALLVITESIQNYLHASHELLSSDNIYFMDYTSQAYPLILIVFAITGILVQMHSMLLVEFESPTSVRHQIIKDDRVIGIKSISGTLVESNDCKLRITTALKQTSTDVAHDCGGSVGLIGVKRNMSELGAINFETQSLHSRDTTIRKFDAQPSMAPECCHKSRQPAKTSKKREASDIACAFIRDFITPITMIVCSLLVLIFDSKCVSELSDVGLSAIAVCLMWAALYPSMKHASMLVLQTVPVDMDITALKQQLLNQCPFIVDLHELRVWCLTPVSSVATCHVVLQGNASSTRQSTVSAQIRAIEDALKRVGIDQVTVQPELQLTIDLNNSQRASESSPSQMVHKKLVNTRPQPTLGTPYKCHLRCCPRQILEDHRPVMQLHAH